MVFELSRSAVDLEQCALSSMYTCIDMAAIVNRSHRVSGDRERAECREDMYEAERATATT